ncbi:hypothetical protein B0H12DRAFT_1242292 [Mycena haematopus]|nr:hypothetical protein B0H12DRAFT_1242292 [Mycena haematopus]
MVSLAINHLSTILTVLLENSTSDSDTEFPEATSLLTIALQSNPGNESNVSGLPTGGHSSPEPVISPTPITYAAADFEAPALSSRTTSDPYLNFQAPYPRSEQDSAMDEQLTTLLGLPLEDFSHLFRVPIPAASDSLDAVDSGTTMPASDGSQEFSDMDLFAAKCSLTYRRLRRRRSGLSLYPRSQNHRRQSCLRLILHLRQLGDALASALSYSHAK